MTKTELIYQLLHCFSADRPIPTSISPSMWKPSHEV